MRIKSFCNLVDRFIFLQQMLGQKFLFLIHFFMLLLISGMIVAKSETKSVPLGKTLIPRKKGAFYPGLRDKERYKTRPAVERFLGKIKENKRLTLRLHKLDVTELLSNLVYA